MKNADFAYHRPETIDAALDLLAEYGESAKVIAGGQSLLPLMALRLARPEHIIDIGRLPGLGDITVGSDGEVAIGALVRHSEAEASEDLARHAPIVHHAIPHIGHRAIRNRGTVCGSIAHGDPAAEMPAVALACDATLVARSKGVVREIHARDFFDGYLETALQPHELLTEMRVPAHDPFSGSSIVEISRRHGDFALIGIACNITVDGTITSAALALFGAAPTPIRARAAEESLVGREPGPDAFAEAADIVVANVNPGSDAHASASYRRHLAGVLTRRGLTEALAQVGAMS